MADDDFKPLAEEDDFQPVQEADDFQPVAETDDFQPVGTREQLPEDITGGQLEEGRNFVQNFMKARALAEQEQLLSAEIEQMQRQADAELEALDPDNMDSKTYKKMVPRPELIEAQTEYDEVVRKKKDLEDARYKTAKAENKLAGILKQFVAGTTMGTMGVVEGAYRIPDTISRFADFAAKQALKGQEKTGTIPGFVGLMARIMPDTSMPQLAFKEQHDIIADEIAMVQKILPMLSPTFAKSAHLADQAEKAVEKLGKGELTPMMDVLFNPEAWAMFIGQAAPSLAMAYATGGNLAFLGAMEALEQTSSIAEYEKATGTKITNADYVLSVGQTAIINGILEKAGLDKVMRIKKAGLKGLVKLAAQGALTESITEGLQNTNTNAAAKLTYDEKKNLWEGIVGSMMGGFGAGAGGGGANVIARQRTAQRMREIRKLRDIKSKTERQRVQESYMPPEILLDKYGKKAYKKMTPSQLNYEMERQAKDNGRTAIDTELVDEVWSRHVSGETKLEGAQETPFDTPEMIQVRQLNSVAAETITLTDDARVRAREMWVEKLMTKMREKAKVTNFRQEKKIYLILGPSAAGKSTVADPIVEQEGALLIDSDEMKKMIPEYEGGYYARAVHEESSALVEDHMFYDALGQGYNIVFPMVGKTLSKLQNMIQDLHYGYGYEVHIRFNKLAPHKAAARALKRFYKQNRYVDLTMIINVAGLKPEQNYDIIKTEKGVSSYEQWSNDVEYGKDPILLERSDRRERGQHSESLVERAGEEGKGTPPGLQPIIEALSEGREVPSEVLEQYPILKRLFDPNPTVELNQDDSDSIEEMQHTVQDTTVYTPPTPEQIEKTKKNINAYLEDLKKLTKERARVVREYGKNKRIDFTGKIIRDTKEFVDQFQVFRSPAIEHLHFVFMDDSGRVLSNMAVSSGHDATVSWSNDDKNIRWLQDRIKQTGATQVVVMHNHPSGDPTPSRGDRGWTAKFFKYVPELKHAIVIDDGKYAVLSRSQRTVGPYWYRRERVTTRSRIGSFKLKGPDYLKSVKRFFADHGVHGHEVMTQLAANFHWWLNEKDKISVIFADADWKTVGWEMFGSYALDNPRIFKENIAKKKQDYGATVWFVAGTQSMIDKIMNNPELDMRRKENIKEHEVGPREGKFPYGLRRVAAVQEQPTDKVLPGHSAFTLYSTTRGMVPSDRLLYKGERKGPIKDQAVQLFSNINEKSPEAAAIAVYDLIGKGGSRTDENKVYTEAVAFRLKISQDEAHRLLMSAESRGLVEMVPGAMSKYAAGIKRWWAPNFRAIEEIKEDAHDQLEAAEFEPKHYGPVETLIGLHKEYEDVIQAETHNLREIASNMPKGGQLVKTAEGYRRTSLPSYLKHPRTGNKPVNDKQWRELAEHNIDRGVATLQQEAIEIKAALQIAERQAKRAGIDISNLQSEYVRERLANLEKDIRVYEEKKLRPSKVKEQIREATGQYRPGPKMVREIDALRGNLKAQARVAAEVMRASKAELEAFKKGAAKEVTQAVKARERRLQAVKRAISEEVLNKLPLSARGRYVRAIANAKTPKDIIKVVARIDQAAADIQRATLVNAIKKQSKRLAASKSISVDYVNQIKDLVSFIELDRHTKPFMQRLQRTQDFINRARRNGEDVSLPADLIKRLAILGRVPVKHISTTMLQNILQDIENLAEIGRTKLRVRQELNRLRREQDISALQETKRLEKHEIIKAKPGERLTFEQHATNFWRGLLNKAMHVDVAISPMDVIFDTLDGTKGYVGPNFRIFKKRVDAAFQGYLDRRAAMNEKAWKLARDLKLDDRNFERIGVYAADRQESGREKLLNTGLTDQEIEAIRLMDPEMKFYNWMRSELDNLRPEIEEVMRVHYNENLGKVENYFSFMTDWDAMSDTEIQQRIGASPQEFGGKPRKNVEMGFTKERTGAGLQKIKLNAMEIFLKHTDAAQYLVEVGPESKSLGELANSKEYGAVAGDYGQSLVLEWIDVIARKGGALQGHSLDGLDQLRKNIGAAVLGFKLSSALIQPTALFDGAALIDGYAFRGVYDFASSREWRQFLLDNMPELRERVADDPSYVEFSDNKTLAQIQQKAFWGLQKLDLLTASSVAAGAYRMAVEKKGGTVDLQNPDADALAEAQRMLRRTQSSAFFKDVPAAISRGKLTGNRSVDKLILQFQNFLLNRWSLIRHDMVRTGIKTKNANQAIQIASFLILANVAETLGRRLSKEAIALLTGAELDDFDDEFKEDMVLNLLQNIPFMGQAISMAYYGSIPVPAMDVTRRLVGGIASVIKGKAEKTKAKGAIRALASTAALFGLPGSIQAEQILRDLAEENL